MFHWQVGNRNFREKTTKHHERAYATQCKDLDLELPDLRLGLGTELVELYNTNA